MAKDVESQSEPSTLPEPTPELVLIRVLVEAFIQTQPRKRSEAFLKRATEILATEEAVALLLPFRPPHSHAAVSRARREAIAVFRGWLPTFLARVPAE